MPHTFEETTGACPLFVHLSDIHFDAKDTKVRGLNELARENLIDDLAAGVESLGVPDAVFVTGDIAYSGKPEQYDQAREFLKRVTTTLRIKPEQVQTVPGNHDVDRSLVIGSVAASRKDLRMRAIIDADNALNDYLVRDPTDPLFAPLAAYSRFAAGYECEVSGTRPFWELPWGIGLAHTLRIRGLTTVLVSDENDVKANLLVGSAQVSLATEARDDIMMILGHHPPDWWRDGDDAEDRMKRYASVHLYGHKHKHRLSVLDDSVRIVAGAVHPERDEGWEPRYNWIQLILLAEGSSVPQLRVKVWPRLMSSADNEFVSGTRVGGWEPDIREVGLPRLSKNEDSQRAATDANQANGGDAVGEDSPFVDPALAEVVAEVVADVERAPAVDSSGSPTPMRHAVYTFGGLGFARQERILVELGLVEDDDRELTVDQRFREAFRRAGQRGVVDALIASIESASEADRREIDGQ